MKEEAKQLIDELNEIYEYCGKVSFSESWGRNDYKLKILFEAFMEFYLQPQPYSISLEPKDSGIK